MASPSTTFSIDSAEQPLSEKEIASSLTAPAQKQNPLPLLYAPGFRVSRCSPGMTGVESSSFQRKLESRRIRWLPIAAGRNWDYIFTLHFAFVIHHSSPFLRYH